MTLFIGLDLGVNKAAICVLDENGGTVLQTMPDARARAVSVDGHLVEAHHERGCCDSE